MKDPLYSLQQVAETLRVSERSVFRYIHSGRLKASKIGYWRIKLSDLRKFLEENSNIHHKLAEVQTKERIAKHKATKKHRKK